MLPADGPDRVLVEIDETGDPVAVVDVPDDERVDVPGSVEYVRADLARPVSPADLPAEPPTDLLAELDRLELANEGCDLGVYPRKAYELIVDWFAQMSPVSPVEGTDDAAEVKRLRVELSEIARHEYHVAHDDGSPSAWVGGVGDIASARYVATQALGGVLEPEQTVEQLAAVRPPSARLRPAPVAGTDDVPKASVLAAARELGVGRVDQVWERRIANALRAAAVSATVVPQASDRQIVAMRDAYWDGRMRSVGERADEAGMRRAAAVLTDQPAPVVGSDDVAKVLDELSLHDNTSDEHDRGYMAAINDVRERLIRPVGSDDEPAAWPNREKVVEVGHNAYAVGGTPEDVAVAVAALFPRPAPVGQTVTDAIERSAQAMAALNGDDWEALASVERQHWLGMAHAAALAAAPATTPEVPTAGEQSTTKTVTGHEYSLIAWKISLPDGTWFYVDSAAQARQSGRRKGAKVTELYRKAAAPATTKDEDDAEA